MRKPTAAIAGAVFVLAAQVFARPALAQPASPPATEQEQVQRETQEAQNRANERAMAAKKAAEPKPFDELDRNKAGYLELDDARRDAWLSEHFAQCDADGDGRVARDEYAACTERQD